MGKNFWQFGKHKYRFRLFNFLYSPMIFLSGFIYVWVTIVSLFFYWLLALIEIFLANFSFSCYLLEYQIEYQVQGTAEEKESHTPGYFEEMIERLEREREDIVMTKNEQLEELEGNELTDPIKLNLILNK